MSLENVEDIYPLTPMQHLMLMHSLRSPGASTLVNQFRYTLRGTLEQSRFAQAWELVLSRHQALRTAFVWEDLPHPLQVVRTQVDVPFEYIDLLDHSPVDRENRTEKILNRDREQGFDLRRAPLLRLLLVRLQDNEYLLIFSRHHLVLDLWSNDIVFDEVFRAYQSLDSLAREPAGRFRSYLDWLDQLDESDAESYWRRYLDGLETPSLLFGSRAQRSQWTQDGQSSVMQEIDGETTAAMAALSTRFGVTTGVMIQGVFALVISVLTDLSDIIYGLTVSARPTEVTDVENIVGSFINNVPVRLRIDEEQTIEKWLQQIQAVQTERKPFEHVSPTEIQRWSNIGANKALFDVLLLLQSTPSLSTTTDNLEIEPMPGPLDAALPMVLAIDTKPAGLILTAVHDSVIVPGQVARTIVDSIITGIAELTGGVAVHVRDLRKFISQTIPEHMLSKTNIGEVDVQSLSVGNAHEESSEADVLLNIFRRSLGNPDVGLDDDFFALGGSSIQAMMAFTEIEQHFGRTMPLSILFSAGSVRNLLVELKLPPAPSTSLVSIQGFGSRPPIIAVSAIDGNVVVFSNVARVLGHNQPFFGLRSKGFEDHEVPINTVEAIAEDYITESSQLLHNPYILFGICFGSNVAIEMAHQLKERGLAPELVVVLNPSIDQVESNSTVSQPAKPSTMGFVIKRIRLWLKTFLEMRGDERRLFLKDKWTVLVRKLRHRDLLHGNRTEIARQRVEAANLAANRRYRPRPYEGIIHTLSTSGYDFESYADPRIAWCEEMQIKTRPVSLPGIDTRDTLVNHAPLLANQLKQLVDEIVSKTETSQ